MNNQTTNYTSTIAYNDPHATTAAVYCSDGRFARQTEQFIQDCLAENLCDRIVTPGGPAAIAGPAAQRHALEQLTFLVKAHNIKRVILIAHEDCGLYKLKLNLTDQNQKTQQLKDLADAAHHLTKLNNNTKVDTYYASITNNTVNFQAVDTRK